MTVSTMTQVTYADIEAFIGERCGDFRCPACGGTRLESAATGDGQPIALLYENSPAKSWFGPPGYLRVFALNCVSCSYVIIFKLDALERWARARPARGADAAPASGTDRHAAEPRAHTADRPTEPGRAVPS